MVIRKNRIIASAFCAALLLGAVACSSPEQKLSQGESGQASTILVSADYPNYTSISSMSDRADTVIRGTVIEKRVEAIDDRSKVSKNSEDLISSANEEYTPNIYTVYTLKVNESFKGKYQEGDKIEVKEFGGQLGDTNYLNKESVGMGQSEDYVMFLETYEDTPASLLNPVQSLYLFKENGGDTASKESSNAQISSVSSENNLMLTMNDLESIKNSYK